MRCTAPLIVGGGPAGAAAAINLLRSGVQPTLIERQDRTHDALCGGFLSWRTLQRLEDLGLDAKSLGGHEIIALHLFTRNRSHRLRFPARAMALSRKRLDRHLLDRVQQMGGFIRHGEASYEGGRIRLGDGEMPDFDSLFLATGKHDLRGLARPRNAAGEDPCLGLRLRLAPSDRLSALLSDQIEMHLFDGGYLGIAMQEDGSVNFCMAVRKSRLAAAGGQPDALFAQLAQDSAYLADRLTGMPTCPDIDAIAHIPYGWRAITTQTGIFRLGDQAGVIASLAGEGLGVALASAERAVEYWRQGGRTAAPAYQHAFARQLRRPLAASGMVAALGRYPALISLLAGIPGAVGLIARLTRV
jgi:flavin-dependent dehydrogenase